MNNIDIENFKEYLKAVINNLQQKNNIDPEDLKNICLILFQQKICSITDSEIDQLIFAILALLNQNTTLYMENTDEFREETRVIHEATQGQEVNFNLDKDFNTSEKQNEEWQLNDKKEENRYKEYLVEPNTQKGDESPYLEDQEDLNMIYKFTTVDTRKLMPEEWSSND